MTKRTKTIIFLTIGVLFFLAAPSIVFYVQGYRVDFREKKIVQTGGLSIKAWPRSTQVYVNGKLKKKTDLLFGQTFIGNLLPGTYFMRVSREGYADWQKEMEIKEKQVTTARNIILFPQDPNLNQFMDQIENAWLSPDGKRMAVEKRNTGTPNIEIIDLASNISLQTFDMEKLIGKAIGLKDLTWSNDGKRFLLKGSSGKSLSWGIGDLNSRNNPYINLTFLGKNATDVTFNNAAQEKLWVSFASGKGYNVFEADLNAKTIGKSPLLQNITAFSAFGDSLVWLDPNGYLSQGDLSGTTRNTLNSNPFQINAGASYRIFSLNPQKILLQEEKTLFYLNPASKNFEKISDSVEELRFSPGERKAAYLSGTELWILYLESQEEQPRKETGERAFLTRLSKKVYQLIWLSSDYLAFINGREIKIAEVDDRDGINMRSMISPSPEIPAKQNEGKLFFSPEDKKLYILENGYMYTSGKPLTN